MRILYLKGWSLYWSAMRQIHWKAICFEPVMGTGSHGVSFSWAIPPPPRYFLNFQRCQTYVSYWISHICQVSPQLSCSDTSQMWMWSKKINKYLPKIRYYPNEEIDKRNFSKHLPMSKSLLLVQLTSRALYVYIYIYIYMCVCVYSAFEQKNCGCGYCRITIGEGRVLSSMSLQSRLKKYYHN